MTLRLLRTNFVAFFLSAIFMANAVAQTASPEIYGALPNVREAKVSPDGLTVALLQNTSTGSAIVFYDISGAGAPPAGVGVGASNARGIEWAGNDYVLLLISQSDRVRTSSGLKTIEFFRWVSVSRSKQKATFLLGNEAGFFLASAGTLISVLPDSPGKALFARYSTQAGLNTRNSGNSRVSKGKSGAGYSLFEVDLKNGRAKQVERGNEETRDWIVNEKGEAIARVDYDASEEKRKIFISQPGASRFELAGEFNEKRGTGSTISFYGLSTKPNMVLATTYGASDKRGLVEYNLTTGAVGETLFRNSAYDIDRIIYDPTKATATAVGYTDDLPRTHHLDAGNRALQASLAKALPGAAPMIVSKSADGNKMVVEAIYTDHPKQFFIFDRQARSMDLLAPSYTALDGKVVAKKEKYDYVSPDGANINGYLTVPAGASKSSMPLIVLPHGGPESRSDQSFSYWPFFYAARGYLVYQPNFRGSDGYGFNFRSSGYGEWGRKMQDDITNGVKKLISDGIADPDRICIAGASYGGYAALAGATLTPDLYACAVSVNGVSNLPGMLGEEARSSGLAEDYWETRIGNRFRDTGALNAVSPAKIAGQAGAPILLIHGKDDTVVPVYQSRQMRDALINAGKPHEYVELDGEDHWLSSGETRIEMLSTSIEFIDKYIGN